MFSMFDLFFFKFKVTTYLYQGPSLWIPQSQVEVIGPADRYSIFSRYGYSANSSGHLALFKLVPPDNLPVVGIFLKKL